VDVYACPQIFIIYYYYIITLLLLFPCYDASGSYANELYGCLGFLENLIHLDEKTVILGDMNMQGS